jgi:hypothetical protein
MALTTFGFGIFVLRPDLMVVEHLQFDGHVRAGPMELRHLSEFRNGTTMFGVNAESVARSVERHPWVKQATAELQWPGTLRVEVLEYEPVALVHFDQLYYVDSTGAVILKASGEDLDYPVFTGMGGALESVHPDLPNVVLRDATWLLRELVDGGSLAAEDISEIHFSRERGFTVHAQRSQIVFGVEKLERRIQRLGLMLEHGLKLGQPLVVDLASDSVAIVRPKNNPGLTG